MDIIIAGVGGQGTVLASRVLGQASLAAGTAAITSETIGMAQREGVVQSHLRLGREKVGPLIPDGSAEVLVGFEPAEAVRAMSKVKPSARALINTSAIRPFTVALGVSHYDEAGVLSYIRTCLPDAILLDATRIAMEAGNIKTMNAVMLGALSSLGIIPIPAENIRGALLDTVRPAYRAVNERAFAAGAAAANR